MSSDPLKAFGVQPGENIWIFGYGSLMWNPDFDFVSAHKATVRGYHRRFCIYSREYRGTREKPGLVLGLDRGGSCHGIVFEVEAEKVPQVLSKLWAREMTPPDIYLAKRISVLVEGKKFRACSFLVNRKHPDYNEETCRDMAADFIYQAQGQRGRNIEYLENTVSHLRGMGICDPGLEDLLDRVRARL